MNISRITLFDFDFISANSVKEVAANIFEDLQTINNRSVNFLITPNAYQIVHFSERGNQHLKKFYQDAAYVLPDGMPIVWLSALIGSGKIQHRLTGSDLFPVLWTEIKRRELSTVFVLPQQELVNAFRQEYSKCECLVPRFFDVADEQYIADFTDDVIRKIIDSKARFVFLGLGFPKQELIGVQLSEKLKACNYDQHVVCLLLGASFEFYFGLKKRAPVFFQKSGLEWLYRFLLEPKRLWKRYTIDNVRFLGIVIQEIVGAKKRTPGEVR